MFIKKNIYIVLIFIAFSCNQNSQSSHSNNDSIGGMSETEWKAHWMDSVRKKTNQEIAFSDTPKTQDVPVKIISARPVKQEYSSYKDVSLTYKNVSGKNIEAIKFSWYGMNAFGEPADMGIEDGLGRGFTDSKLRVGKTTTSEWSVLSKDLKKITKAWAYEVVFEDGTKWTSSK